MRCGCLAKLSPARMPIVMTEPRPDMDALSLLLKRLPVLLSLSAQRPCWPMAWDAGGSAQSEWQSPSSRINGPAHTADEQIPRISDLMHLPEACPCNSMIWCEGVAPLHRGFGRSLTRSIGVCQLSSALPHSVSPFA